MTIFCFVVMELLVRILRVARVVQLRLVITTTMKLTTILIVPTNTQSKHNYLEPAIG